MITQGLHVKVVLSMAASHTLEVGDVVTHLLDGLNLLSKQIALQKISHL